MKLKELLYGLKYQSCMADPETAISGISRDTRHIADGYLFFVREGSAFNAYDCISDLIRQGVNVFVSEKHIENVQNIVVPDIMVAQAQISANYYKHPDRHLNMVGITGTNGKTTTAYMVRKGIETVGHCGYTGTTEYFDGMNATPALLTTPESDQIYRLLSLMLENTCHSAVMEVSAHALSLGRVDSLTFDVAVFTNLTQDHLDYYSSMDQYLEAKLTLFKKLPKDGFAVINIDCTVSDQVIASCTCRKENIITFSSIKPEADIFIKRCEYMHNLEIELIIDNHEYKTSLPFPGDYNSYNLAAAAGVFKALNLNMKDVLNAVSAMAPVPGRTQLVKNSRGLRVIVDYAHTPDGLLNVVSSLKENAENRLITVFGCGGDRDRLKRPIMMENVCMYSDMIIATSDNPRTEVQSAIFEDMRKGNTYGKKVDFVENRTEAIRQAILSADKDDIVLIAGKGHENYQIMGKQKSYFSDYEVAQTILESL